MKFPPASAKNPTVFNPPNVVPLPATIAPAPALAVGSYVNRTGPPDLEDMSAAYTKYVPSAFTFPTTACVGFFACTSHVATFSVKPPAPSESTRHNPLPLASQ